MASWVVALALSAGYLINRKMAIADQVEKASDEFHRAKEASTDGLSSAEVRASHKTVTQQKDHSDFNVKVPRADVREVKEKEAAASLRAEQFDGASTQIQGVYLQQFS